MYKRQVLEANAKWHGKLSNPDQQLRKASGFAFYNTSRYDFDTLLADAPNLKANLRNYIAGFSFNMREVLEKFDFDNTITKLDEAGLLTCGPLKIITDGSLGSSTAWCFEPLGRPVPIEEVESINSIRKRFVLSLIHL